MRHRVELFRVAVLDVCGAPVEKATPAQRRVECECKATALAVIQVLLPKSGAGETNRDGRAFGCQATLSGLLIHHSLVLHLTDDFVPGNGSPGNGSQLGEVLDVTKTEDKQAQLLLFTAKMAVLLHLAQHPHGMRELGARRTLERLAACRYLLSHVRSEQHLRSLIRAQAGAAQSAGIIVQRFHLLVLPTLKLFLMLLHDGAQGRAVINPALDFLWAHRYLVRELLLVGGGAGMGVQGAGMGGQAPWRPSIMEESDECIEERRLLLDGFLILERLGALDPATRARQATSAPPPPPFKPTAVDGIKTAPNTDAEAAGGGVRVKELDSLVTAATAHLLRDLLEATSKSSFWQAVVCQPVEPTARPPRGLKLKGVKGLQKRSQRRAMQILQTCEISLRIFLARTRRVGGSATRAACVGAAGGLPESAGDVEQDLLVFDCSSLLPGGRLAMRLRGGGFGVERQHLVPVEPLVHFFCRCVEHVCGDGQGVDGAGDLGMPDGFGGLKGSGVNGGGGAGLTRSGGMTAWMRYRNSEQQENQEHQEHEHALNTAAPPGAQAAQDREGSGQERRVLVQLLRLCEVSLSALVESIFLAASLHSAPPQSDPAFGNEVNANGRRGGLLAHLGTQSCLHAVWNEQRTGAAQRLLHFSRQRLDDCSSHLLHADSVFIQLMTKRLSHLVEVFHQQVES